MGLLDQKVASMKKAAEVKHYPIEEAEETDDGKIIISVWGEKNASKTATSYGIFKNGEKCVVLSFDHKSKRPLSLPWIKEADIKVNVLNMLKYYDESTPELIISSAVETQNYIVDIVSQIKEKYNPDWIVVDCTDKWHRIMEMVMRAHNGLKPTSGVSNPSVWIERNSLIDSTHKKLVEIANIGVIYTMYSKEKKIIIGGNVLNQTDIPKWLGSIMTESDVVINVTMNIVDKKPQFVAEIFGSKYQDDFPDGVYDVTGKRLIECF